MNILVYPHDLGMGGSQINAIDLATKVRDLGHQVTVFGQPGVLVERIRHAGLEFIESPRPRMRPTPSIVRKLRRLIREGSLDVVHGYEWPPTLEAAIACRGTRAVPVSTTLSMGVAPFLPDSIPLIVGTEQIMDGERRAGRRRLGLMEPPIDTNENAPGAAASSPADLRRWGCDAEAIRIVVVSRLVREMKLEGIHAALEAVQVLGRDYPVQLIIAGDGNAADDVAQRAEAINSHLGRIAVVLTGELQDPRPVYDLADIALGMGSSALRAMAFAKPLIVQGINGFWEPLTEETLPLFLWQGWYGTGAGAASGTDRLILHLRHLIDHPEKRHAMGSLGLSVVRERFGLDAAARNQVAFYERAVADRPQISGWLAHPGEDMRSAGRFVQHEIDRRLAQRRGNGPDEDFNSRSTVVKEKEGATGHRSAAS